MRNWLEAASVSKLSDSVRQKRQCLCWMYLCQMLFLQRIPTTCSYLKVLVPVRIFRIIWNKCILNSTWQGIMFRYQPGHLMNSLNCTATDLSISDKGFKNCCTSDKKKMESWLKRKLRMLPMNMYTCKLQKKNYKDKWKTSGMVDWWRWIKAGWHLAEIQLMSRRLKL